MENEQQNSKDLGNKEQNAQQQPQQNKGEQDISKEDVLQGMGEGIEKEEEEQ